MVKNILDLLKFFYFNYFSLFSCLLVFPVFKSSSTLLKSTVVLSFAITQLDINLSITKLLSTSFQPI